jgi:hypothetical protein
VTSPSAAPLAKPPSPRGNQPDKAAFSPRLPQKRVQTVLNRLAPKDDKALNAELASALEKVYL